jgi:hypothetical protein
MIPPYQNEDDEGKWACTTQQEADNRADEEEMFKMGQ